MNDRVPPDNTQYTDDDPGKPIAELADLEDSAPSGFFDRLARRIERRVLSVDFVDFARQGVFGLFVEYWSLLVSFLKGGKEDEGGVS